MALNAATTFSHVAHAPMAPITNRLRDGVAWLEVGGLGAVGCAYSADQLILPMCVN